MSLSPRAVAVQGVGFGSLQVVALGLLPVDEAVVPPAPFSSNLGPIRKPTVDLAAKRRRRNAALLLTLLH